MTDVENSEDYAEITRVIRAAIDDAYRFGLGSAIEIAERWRPRIYDRTFDDYIQALREQSATGWRTAK